MMHAFRLISVTIFVFCGPALAKDPEFKDATYELWRAQDASPYLRVSAGVDKDGNLLLVKYEVTHFLPASPNDGGGIDVHPLLRSQPLEGAWLRTVDGKRLTLSEFQERFETKPNVSRVERGMPVRERHELILFLEQGRSTPSFFPAIFRPDLVVVTLPRKKSPPIESSRPTDGVPVP